MPKTMKTDAQIKAIIDRELEHAIGVDGSELATNRAEAMKYYLCEPRGDELKGRSQVISADVADVIEWLKPQVIQTFLTSDKIVRFDPVGEEDVAQSEQESDYCNHAVMKDNDSFVVFTSLISDCLLQKNGYVKIYWQDAKPEREEYEGLTPDDLVKLLDDPTVEITELTERFDVNLGIMVADVVVMREAVPGKVQIDPVPPEELRIARGHNAVTLANCRFVAHVRDVPASDLIAQGYDKATVDGLPTTEVVATTEQNQREPLDPWLDSADMGDASMRLIRVHECYILMDCDGDGIAELRQIVYAGDAILSNDAVDSIPFASATAIFQPHVHNGLSFFDRIRQIQDEKTALKRQLLDNLYLMNNQRTYVNMSAGVNFRDLMTNRPGGIVRGQTAYGEAMSPIPTPALPPQSFQMLTYLDQEREERSGVGPGTASQMMNVANDTAHAMERVMSAKELLVGMVIRTIAETGVKEMILLVRELLMKHQDKQKVVKLRGKWIPVNPSDWKTRLNTTVKVGLGAGDRMRKQVSIQQVMALQEKLLAGGKGNILVDDKTLYKTIEDFARYSDVSADKYFLNPESPQVIAYQQKLTEQPPAPDPQMEAIKAQLQVEQMRIQAQMQKSMADNQLKQAELKLRAQELQLKLRDQAIDERQISSREAIEIAKMEVDMLAKGFIIDLGQPGMGSELNNNMQEFYQ